MTTSNAPGSVLVSFLTGIVVLVILSISVFFIYLAERNRPVFDAASTRTCSYRETGSSIIIECPVSRP